MRTIQSMGKSPSSSHPTAIESVCAILTRLKKACVPGATYAYGLCHYRLFRGITLQLFTNSPAGGRVMELEKVVSMGISMVRVNVKLPFLHSFGPRALFLGLYTAGRTWPRYHSQRHQA